MYLYRTQLYILKSLNKHIVATNTPMDDFYMSLLELINDAPKSFSNKMKRYPRAHAALAAKNYIKYGGVAADKTVLIKMTQDGLNALSTHEFVVKQDNLKAVVIRDSILAASGLIVAAATIYALLEAKNKSEQTQEEIWKLKEELRTQKKESTRLEDSIRTLKLKIIVSASPKKDTPILQEP